MNDLSLEKLFKTLETIGCTPQKVYVNNGATVFIQSLIESSCEEFFTYIPSRYHIKCSSRLNPSIIQFMQTDDEKITIDILDSEDTSKDHYSDSIDLETNLSETNVADELELNYNNSIHIKALEKYSSVEIKNIKRQLKRFSNALSGSPYKILISSNNCLGYLDKNNEIETCYIKNFSDPPSTNKFFFVVVSLETLIKHKEKTITNVGLIRQSLTDLINKNQIRTNKILNSLFEVAPQLDNTSLKILQKKKKLINEINNLTSILNQVSQQLQDKRKLYASITDRDSFDNIHREIEMTQNKTSVHSELEEIMTLKSDVEEKLRESICNYNSLIIVTDRIFFESSVLMDEITKNFKNLQKYID